MSKEVVIKTQKQLDAIKPNFEGTIYIDGGERYAPLELNTSFDDARVVVRGEAWIRLRGSSHAELWGSSHAELWGSSHAVLRGSSHAVLRESSHALLRESSHAELWGSSHAVLRESSHAVLWGSSHAVLRESSHAVLRESSHARLFGEAMVSAFSAKEIICKGYNVISLRKSNRPNINIVMNKDSYLKIVPDFEPTFKEYEKRYPVEKKGKFAILYKKVHKIDGKYIADHSVRGNSFEYVIGQSRTEVCDQKQDNSCSNGLHIAHFSWAREYGYEWADGALLECKVPIDKIVVSKDCDGKMRTSELVVIREVPKEEWYELREK